MRLSWCCSLVLALCWPALVYGAEGTGARPYALELDPAVASCEAFARSVGMRFARDLECSPPTYKRLLQIEQLGAAATLRAIIRIEADASTSKTVRIRAERLRIEDETDPRVLEWSIAPGAFPQEGSLPLVAKRLREFMGFDANLKAIKSGLLAIAVAHSDALAPTAGGDSYTDTNTGEMLKPETAYRRFLDEKESHRHLLRAMLEGGALLSLGMANYYGPARSVNERDWDLPFDFSTLANKVLLKKDHWSFDNNLASTNTSSHALGGFSYYTVARSNGLSTLESFTFGFLFSAAWESLVEYKERASINDQILTPPSGIAIGEVFYQIGRLFNDGQGLFAKTLGVIFGAPDAFHRWLDGRNHRRATEAEFDRLGIPRDRWHSVEVAQSLGGVIDRSGGPTGTAAGISLVASLITLPGYGEEGIASGWVTDTASVDLEMSKAFGPGGRGELLFLTRAALAGYHHYRKEGEKGVSFFVGAATGFELSKAEDQSGGAWPDAQQDVLGAVNILGPTMDVTWFYKGLRVRLRVDVYGDFAIVHSFAVGRYSETHSLEGIQTVLMEHAYYYGVGYTVAPKLAIEAGPFQWVVDSRYRQYTSLSARDRFEERVVRPVDASDTFWNLRVWQDVALPLPRKSREGGVVVKLRFTPVDARFREGRVEQTRRSGAHNQVTGGFVVTF